MVINISQRLIQLQRARKALLAIDSQIEKVQNEIWHCQSILKHQQPTMISCVSVEDYNREHPITTEKQKVIDMEGKLYSQMIKPFKEIIIKKEKERARIWKTIGVTQSFDGEGNDITYDMLDERIKEMKMLGTHR